MQAPPTDPLCDASHPDESKIYKKIPIISTEKKLLSFQKTHTQIKQK